MFNPDGYRKIIGAAQEAGYTLTPVRDAYSAVNGPRMLLRHDVDMSLDYAVALAELECELGVRSTYYILLYNDFYNPLSTTGRQRLRRLVECGHEVGLHWDSSLYPPEDAQCGIRRDMELLSEITECEVISASQHIPTDRPYLDVSELFQIETYSHGLQAKYRYVSDSCMQWRTHTPLDLVEQRENIQFLAHPIWWVAEGETRAEKLAALNQQTQSQIQTTISDFSSYIDHALAQREKTDAKFRDRRNGA